MEPSRVWVFVSIDYGIIDYSDRGYNWLYHNEWTVNLQHQNKNSSSYIPSHLSMSCTKILGNSLFYCTIRVSKSFVSFSPCFSLSPPPTYQPQRCFFRCTLKYTDADIIRTDSVQHVEPIAFEHLNVRRQILATVDPCKMKWVLTVRTGNRHLWEIEQLQLLWNSLRTESSTVVGCGTLWELRVPQSLVGDGQLGCRLHRKNTEELIYVRLFHLREDTSCLVNPAITRLWRRSDINL